MNNLLIIGRGQYSFVVHDIALSMNAFDKIDFLDDKSEDAIGQISDSDKLIGTYNYAIVSIGDTQKRLKITEQLEKTGYKIATIVSPRAYVFQGASIASGCVIEPYTVVGANSTVDKCCIISAGAVINHNSQVGKGAHLDCNSTVPSNSKVPPSLKLNCGKVFNSI